MLFGFFPGFGIDQLRDGSIETYWQSDGPQPHLVNIQFRRKTTVHDICIYADYKADESYTPNRSVTYFSRHVPTQTSRMYDVHCSDVAHVIVNVVMVMMK